MVKKKQPTIIYNPEHKGMRWVDHPADGLRFVNHADEIIHLLHTGWYIDGMEAETFRGVVYQLPARNGMEQFVPGYVCSRDNSGARLNFHYVTDDKNTAARWADDIAQREAERERRYNSRRETYQYDDDAEAAFDGEHDEDGMLAVSLAICEGPEPSPEED